MGVGVGAKRGTEIKKHRGDNAVQYNDSYWRWVGGWGRGGLQAYRCKRKLRVGMSCRQMWPENAQILRGIVYLFEGKLSDFVPTCFFRHCPLTSASSLKHASLFTHFKPPCISAPGRIKMLMKLMKMSPKQKSTGFTYYVLPVLWVTHTQCTAGLLKMAYQSHCMKDSSLLTENTPLCTGSCLCKL